MASWSKRKVDASEINKGQEYTKDDNVSVEELNAIVNNSFNAQGEAEKSLNTVKGFQIGTVVSSDTAGAKINVDSVGEKIILNLELPKGDKGDKGDKGEAGYGTMDYPELFNKPKINGKELNGDLSTEDLGIETISKDELKNYLPKSGGTLNGNLDFLKNMGLKCWDGANLLTCFDDGSVYLSEQNKSTIINGSQERPKYNSPTTGLVEIALTSDKPYQFAQEEYEKSLNLLDISSGKANGLSYSITNNSLRLYGATDAYGTYQIDLSHLKGQEVTLKIDEVNVVSGIPFIVFYADTDIFNEVASNGYTKTFTVPTNANIAVLSFYANRGSTVGDVTLTNIMLNKGSTALPYHPYNANKHITNDQAEFLKSEYDKTLNKLNFNSYEYRKSSNLGLKNTFYEDSVTSVGTANYDYGEFCRFKVNLKANTKYAISLSTNQDAFAWFRNASVSTIATATFTETSNYRIVSFSEDVYLIDIGWEHLVAGQSYNLTMSKIMLNEGEPLPYQEYNGEIVHKGDIENTYAKYINTQNRYTFSSSNVLNTTWENNIANGWLYIKFYSDTDNTIHGNVELNGKVVATIQRVKYSDLGFLIPIKKGDIVGLWTYGETSYEARDCYLYY